MRATTRWVLATAGASLVAFACSFTTSGSGGPGSTPDPFDAAGLPGTSNGSQGGQGGTSNGGAPSNGSPGTSNGSVGGGTSNGSVTGGGNSGGTGPTADAG